jgi:hypothetical protein
MNNMLPIDLLDTSSSLCYSESNNSLNYNISTESFSFYDFN